MNVEYSPVTAILQDWNAPEYSDIFDEPKINFDEREVLKKVCAGGVGRREDQIIIDALEVGATTLTVPKTIGDTDGMNTAKFRRAKLLLDKASAGMERSFVMSATALSDMLGDQEPTSSDYNVVKSLVSGELKAWLGFKIYTVGDMQEGGLPKTGNTRSAFAIDKPAMGYAIGIDMRTEINYIAHKTSWLVNTVFSAGAVAIDAYGLVTISHDEL
jgi:hypothetical protein